VRLTPAAFESAISSRDYREPLGLIERAPRSVSGDFGWRRVH
jgi:hypothetical protein